MLIVACEVATQVAVSSITSFSCSMSVDGSVLIGSERISRIECSET